MSRVALPADPARLALAAVLLALVADPAPLAGDRPAAATRAPGARRAGGRRHVRPPRAC